MTLTTQAWTSLVVLAVAVAAVLFVAAGTVHYWEAWMYLVVFVGASAFITADLIKRDPELLSRRMRGGPTAEQETTQRVIMIFASLAFAALLVMPALDRRLHWSSVPTVVVLAGDVLVLMGFSFIGRVYRENTYTAATIRVESGQRVISTGAYDRPSSDVRECTALPHWYAARTRLIRWADCVCRDGGDADLAVAR